MDKKRAGMFVFLIFVIILMLSFVSAGLFSFSDWWGKITGKVTGSCTDSDVNGSYPDGKNYYLKGYVDDGISFTPDICDTPSGSNPDQYLREYYCAGGIADIYYNCADEGKICDLGACVEASPDPVCGNGVVEAGEECDDGNTANGDGCSSNCFFEYCGDGITNNVDEGCDDGNTANGDGCSSECVIEICTDSDGGKDYSTSGSVTIGTTTQGDVCYTFAEQEMYNVLRETYCNSSGELDYQIFDCPCCTGTPLPENCLEYATCPTNYDCDSTGSCSEILPTCGDGSCNGDETCSSCPDDCLASGQICCNDVAYDGDCCDDLNCPSGTSCNNHNCPNLCVDGKQEYSFSDLSINSECGKEFKSEEITENLSTLGKTPPTLDNKAIRKTFNITVNDTVTNSRINFTLDRDDFRFPINELLIYIEDGSTWTLLNKESVSLKSGSIYTYTVSAQHFSLFLIVEPDYCGNNVFEPDYYEECDGSAHCTNECVCETGYNVNASGFCLESLIGTGCSTQGEQICQGYTLYECDSDLTWEEKGLIVGNCSVNCLPGEKDCSGETSLLCGLNYDWVSQGKISGQCGYVSESSNNTSDGNGETENSKLLIFIIIGAGLFIFLIILIFFSRSKHSSTPAQSISPPETQPGSY